jgi:hypothetical protein
VTTGSSCCGIVPGEVPTELIVVENFFEELQAKVKR